MMCNEFVCEKENCLYVEDCSYYGCLIALRTPCNYCSLKHTSCAKQRKRTDSLNSGFANSASDYSQEPRL